MKIFSEFKDFAIKGNVIDLAVAVVIGAAFGKIVASFVADIIMPPIGMLLGGADFASLAVVMKEAIGDKPAVLWSYGKFLQTVVDFVIIAFSIFMVVKAINKMKKAEAEAPAAPPEPTNEEKLLTEIRDLLKK